jgi:hypothetical protein
MGEVSATAEAFRRLVDEPFCKAVLSGIEAAILAPGRAGRVAATPPQPPAVQPHAAAAQWTAKPMADFQHGVAMAGLDVAAPIVMPN